MSVNSLPDEMLAEIFECCVEGDTGEPGGKGLGISPRILALVNRNWYRVALATASLWRRILVTDETDGYWRLDQNRRLPQTEGNKATQMRSALQVCTTQAQLESALQKTRGISLDITIAFTFRRKPGRTAPYDQFYSALFNDLIAPRITRLSFESQGYDEIEGSSLTHLSSHIHLLSNLFSLTRLSPEVHLMTEDKSILQLILENAGNLQELSLGKLPVPSCLKGEIWHNAGYSSTIRNLHRLRLGTIILNEIFRHVVSISIAELVIEEADRMAAEVEDGNEMDFPTLYTHPWPDKLTHEITFTRITRIHLILDDVSLLSRVHFPVLEHLRLSQSGEYHPNLTFRDVDSSFVPKFSIKLPKLRSLRVMAQRFAPLSQFYVPQLESLHITSNFTMRIKNDADFSALFPSSPTSITPLADDSKAALDYPSFHALKITHTLHVNADVSEELLLQALGSLPMLRVLSLVPGKMLGLTLIQGLTVEKSTSPSKVKGILCPDLQVMDVDLISFIEWDGRPRPGVRVGTATLEGISSALDQCVSSHRNAGVPLRRCTVTDSLGKREYVELDV